MLVYVHVKFIKLNMKFMTLAINYLDLHRLSLSFAI